MQPLPPSNKSQAPSGIGSSSQEASTVIHTLDLTKVILDNVSKAIKYRSEGKLNQDSFKNQVMPLLNKLTELISSSNNKYIIDNYLSNIVDLQSTINTNGDSKHIMATIYKMLWSDNQKYQKANPKDAHVIVEQLKDDPLIKQLKQELSTSGKEIKDGWQFIFPDSSQPAKVAVVFDQQVTKTDSHKITVLISNVRTADVGEEPNKEHNWEKRRETYMKILDGTAPVTGDINDPNNSAERLGPSDLIGLQEVNNNKHKGTKDGLTQAQFIRRNIPTHYGAVPQGKGDVDLERIGLMILYNKVNLTAVGELQTIKLGHDPEGGYERQMIGQRFRINGTDKHIWFWNGHGAHKFADVGKKEKEVHPEVESRFIDALTKIKQLNPNNEPSIIGGDWNTDWLNDIKTEKDPDLAKSTYKHIPNIQKPTRAGNWNKKDSDDFQTKGTNDTIIVQGSVDLKNSTGVVCDVFRTGKHGKVAVSDHRPVRLTLKID